MFTGGTADITVHEVTWDGKLIERHKASGGAWGGTSVDESYRQLLFRLMGSPVLHKFHRQHTDDYLDMFREFETKKRTISSKTSGKVNFRLPLALVNVFEEVTEEKLQESIAQSTFAGQIFVSGDKMRIESSVVKGLFDNAISSIVEHMQELLTKPEVRETSAILMVGGFSESPMLQDAIKQNFPNLKLIIPQEAGLAVLIGAVIFGHSPADITERKCRNTYGISTRLAFKPAIHPQHKKEIDSDGTEMCGDIFDPHINEGTSVHVGQAQAWQGYQTAHDDQKVIGIRVFASPTSMTKFVTDTECNSLGKMSVPITNPGPKGKDIEIRMTFGGTEIVVEGRDEDGVITTGTFDFLG
jgi:molecular chaperone DnaK (HSP70)